MPKWANGSVCNPHDTDDDIHALSLAALVLVVPDTVLLGVPVGTSSGVHSAATDSASASGWGRRGIRAGGTRVCQVLDDCGVYGELVLDLALGLGDESGQDAFLQGLSEVMCNKKWGRKAYNDVGVPLLGLGVVV